MRTIYLVRHGKVKQEDGLRRCIGQTDLPLDDAFLPSIVELGAWFQRKQQGRKASMMLASGTLQRASHTAACIREGAGDIISGNIVFDTNLNEVDTGLWENRPFEEIRANEGRLFEERGKSLGYFRFPQGESIYEAGKRFEKGLNHFRKETGKDLILVSHAGAIRAFCVNCSHCQPMTTGSWERPTSAPRFCWMTENIFFLSGADISQPVYSVK